MIGSQTSLTSSMTHFNFLLIRILCIRTLKHIKIYPTPPPSLFPTFLYRNHSFFSVVWNLRFTALHLCDSKITQLKIANTHYILYWTNQKIKKVLHAEYPLSEKLQTRSVMD